MKHIKAKILIGLIISVSIIYNCNNALANVVFDGGFETGDHSQWADIGWNQDRPEAEQFEVVTDIVRDGKYSAKLTVHDGDEFLDTGGERVQLERPDAYNEHEGDEYWYSWSTYFPEDWQSLTNSPNDWLLIADWHASNNGDFADVCQPLQIEVDGNNKLYVRMLTGNVAGYNCYDGSGTANYFEQEITDSLSLGHWNDFIIHVQWTATDNGMIEVWHRTDQEIKYNKVVERKSIPTLQYIDTTDNTDVPYFILAHYRSAEQSHTSVLYHDAFKQMDDEDDLNIPEGNNWWRPQLSDKLTWQWQLNDGDIDTSYDVDMYDVDLFDTPVDKIQELHQQKKIVICYFSAGSWEDWRSDASDFPESVKGNDLDGWAGEKWLDIRSTDLQSIMRARLDLAKDKGCDGVEPDNIDGYTNNTGFALTADDQLKYNRWLSWEAHTRNLSIGLKNDLDQTEELINDFDWALNEECYEHKECSKYKPFIYNNKAVFGVEYNLEAQDFCLQANRNNFSWLKKNYDLDNWRYGCEDYKIIHADVNRQNDITSTDAALILRKSLGLDMTNTSWQDTQSSGEVNCDGKVTSTDALLTIRKSLDLNMDNTNWCPKQVALNIEGGGVMTKGGRGGVVYEVTNLEDSGEGSFRYGLENISGPRTIVFKVGGYIHLDSVIGIDDDAYITIAGQTAPGDGITIVYPTNPDESVLVFNNVHDVIIQYLRLRRGGGPASDQAGSVLAFSHDSYNIAIDHCSVSWSGDENISLWSQDVSTGLRNVTVQNSIISEGLWNNHHSTGIISGTNSPDTATTMKNISIHHNFFATNYNRNPLLKVASGDIVNNLIYNWRWWATGFSGGIKVDIKGNQYKAGPATRDSRPALNFHPYSADNNMTGVDGDPSIYLKENIGPNNSDPDADAWDSMMVITNDYDWGYPDGQRTAVPRDYERTEPRTFFAPIITDNVLELEDILLTEQGVGASRRLNAYGQWVSNRDEVDKRVINDYNNTTGNYGLDGLLENVDDVSTEGGWPYWNVDHYSYITEAEFVTHPELYQLRGGEAYLDSDHDGMPDAWEDNNGLDKYDATDGNSDYNNNGYTNLEEFLNGKNSPKTYPPERTFTAIPTDTTTAYPGYMSSVKETPFGNKVTRLSNYDDHNINLSYPKTQDWNRNMNFIILNYQVIDTSDWQSLGLIDGQFFDYRWSNIDPNVLYGLKHLYNDDDQPGGFEDDFVFKRMKILEDNSFQYDDLISFSHNDYDWVYTGPGEGNIDFNDKYVVFAAKKKGVNYLTAILYDIQEDTVSTHDFTEIHWGDEPYVPGITEIDWISISPLGKYIVINWRPDEDGAIYQYDLEFNLVRQLSQRAGHGDLGVTETGEEIFLQYEYDTRRGVWQYNLETGEEERVLPDKYNGGHISCRNYRRRGWCYLSTTQEGYREIFALKLDGSGMVNRFVQTRTTGGNSHGSVSPDGTKVLFKSDWNGQTAEVDGVNVHEVFMAEMEK